MRIAINGFGRIGRSVFRILEQQEGQEVAAINDLFDPDALAYLLKYDTVMGGFDGDVSIEGEFLKTPNNKIRMLHEREPAELPWKEMGIDVVIESTGIFVTREQLQKHLDAGAGRVILTVPPKGEIDYMVVLGVNEDGLKPEHRMISNASCTTNCLAPVAKVLHERFGICKGLMTTIHSYTNDQRILDLPHKDLRRARAAALSMIPTTTGAALAVTQVLPELEGKLDGISIRVPTPKVSLIDLTAVLEKDVSEDEVKDAFREAAKTQLKGILAYSDEPLVSSDFTKDPHSAIVDGPFIKTLGNNMVKILAWYDNEWGYSCRVVELAEFIGKKL